MQYVGLDVSGKEVVAVWKDERGNIMRQENYANCEEELKKLAALLQGCEAAVESSNAGLFVYDCLSSFGASVIMANPAQIALIFQSSKKTDRNDAAVLADLLRTNMLPLSYVPPKEIRIQRDLVRQRQSLVHTSVKFKNKIRSELAVQGLHCPAANIFGEKASGWLAKAPLQQHSREHIKQLLRLGNEIELEIASLDAKIRDAYARQPQAALLDTMPGIAKHSAVVILSEIGGVERFDSPKKLCSYAGLVPKVSQSGDTCHMGHIKHGSKMLKTTLVQDAHAAVYVCPRFRKFFNKVKRKKGRQKAIVALAHKMLTIIWHMLKKNKPFDGRANCEMRRTAA